MLISNRNELSNSENTFSEIRNLTDNEINQVSGGIFPMIATAFTVGMFFGAAWGIYRKAQLAQLK